MGSWGPNAGSAKTLANLLIVDDDFDIVELMTEVLETEGHAVRSARTGEDGLKMLRSAPLPDSILLDVDMPVLGGPGMAHKMLLHDSGEEDVPIILCSARSDLPSLASEMGTPYWLTKPFELSALLTVLQRAIRERVAPACA